MVVEYIATKVVWICKLILELEVILSIQLPMKIHHDCDNVNKTYLEPRTLKKETHRT